MIQKNAQVRLNPAEETIQVGPTRIRFLVTGSESNGDVATLEMTIPAETLRPAPPHSHEGYEETIYGVEGISTWTVNGTPIEVGPGQTICIPRGAVHGFANRGSVDAKVLVILTPAAIGPEFFRELAAIVDTAAGGPPDMAKMGSLMKRYGLTAAPPPSA